MSRLTGKVIRALKRSDLADDEIVRAIERAEESKRRAAAALARRHAYNRRDMRAEVERA